MSRAVGTRKGFGKRHKATQCQSITCDTGVQCSLLIEETDTADEETHSEKGEKEKDENWDPAGCDAEMNSDSSDNSDEELFEKDDELLDV